MNRFQLFSLLVALATTQAFHKLIPPDKETVYLWSANIKAGTHLPVPYASQYALQGKIHLQGHNKSIFVKLTDLTHRLYNGIIDHRHEYEAKNLSLPQEVHDLQSVFRITYTDDGLVEGISTQKSEKEFSRNIKKAIASILQINSSTVLRKEYHRLESFVVKENSIYEHGNDVYSVLPQNGETIEVHKSHNMLDSEDIYSYFVTTTEGASCDMKSAKSVMHDSHKRYILNKEGDSYVVKNITVLGNIVYYPFKARSDAQMISTSQTFDLVEVVPIEEKYHIDEEYFEKSLSYRPFEDNKDGLILDETNGRRSVDYEKLVPMVQNMLKDIPQYMREDHITTEVPDNKRGQLINRVQQILLKFNIQKLEELKSTLPEDALNIFYHILPLIGTESSTLYIKTLIVTKTVSEDLAIELLQNIAGHIRPSVHLVHKLEELIYLNSTFTWNLRKVAILSLGNIIYKSYLNQLQLKSDDPQKPYEKYVDHYIRNLRNSSSYIVQVTYLLGLRNMKLPLLAHRLVPAFNGEWWSNQYLRYMAIWAVAPPILSDFGSDKIIETFWSLFINRNEKLEIRAFAYYYVMYSRPSLSQLRNIFTYMLTEPDEEMYRIHYTLSQTLMQSTDPCHQEIKERLAQVLKFSPPPRGGVSFINFFGYRDDEFGYSAGVQKYFWKSNELRMYCYYITSQLFYNYEEEYVFYWKIRDGRNEDPGLLQSIGDIIKSISRHENIDFHIEASIARRGQVINIFAFDKNSFNELLVFLKLFIIMLENWNKNVLYINHERYNSYLIPTDLGIPAFWQYFMPEVHYNNLTIVKAIEKESVNFYVENKYGAWIHYRHGLSFYNPVADIWQGINKYHAYDALLPLHFNLTLDKKLEKLEVHWQKHNDLQMNIAGLRTHATQLVFARDSDDYEKKVVPQGEELQVVGHGKDFRHDYSLIDEDSLDTGHRLYLVNYDSDLRFPFGTFKRRLLMFADPSTKYFHSPLQHWILVWLNFHRNVVLLPKPGTYGFVARLEPSKKFDVTSIDFIWLQKLGLLGNSSHVPGFYSHSHLIHSVKNHDKILKTWNLNALIEVASGHNYGSLDFKLSRIIPEQKDYKVCIEGYKKWATKEAEGHWIITLGESNNEECVNDTMIDITSTGRRSHEQISGKYKHSSCQYLVPYSALHYHSMECLFSLSTLRHSTYEVTGTNVPPQLKQALINLGDDLRSYLHSYYSYKTEHNENITKDAFKLDVTFPLEAHEVDVEIATTDQTYEFSGVPLKYWDYFKITPESTTYSSEFIEKHKNENNDHCIIRLDHRYLNKKYVSEEVPNEWTLYVLNTLESSDHDYVYLKQLYDKIAVKIVRGEHELKIVPDEESNLYHVTLDGITLSSEQHQEDWLHYSVFADDSRKLVVVFLQQTGVHVEYDIRRVVLTIPQGAHWYGRCYPFS